MNFAFTVVEKNAIFTEGEASSCTVVHETHAASLWCGLAGLEIFVAAYICDQVERATWLIQRWRFVL